MLISIKLPLVDSAQVNVTLLSDKLVPFSVKVIEAASKFAEAKEDGIILNVCSVSVGCNRITKG